MDMYQGRVTWTCNMDLYPWSYIVNTTITMSVMIVEFVSFSL